ncbi:MAG: heme o synthase [Flavobacteriales bacterium]|nr:heme o synthase [Flavobacteriales bacterium]
MENLKSAESISRSYSFGDRLKDIAAFFKVRLTFIVVLSSFLGYLMGAEQVSWFAVSALVVGGFLLTGASNGLNQVWERDLDGLMKRTQNRPLPTGRMGVAEGITLATVSGLAGILILWQFLNPLSGLLGAIAIFFYVFLYTPMKQRSPLAVFIGAFPGAIPPMLGYVAATGDFNVEPGTLFATQFMWQFPHFWAIAWVAHEDYTKAGYKLLPFNGGRTKSSAFQIFLYSMVLIPVSLLPWALPAEAPMIGNWGAAVVAACGAIFAWYAWKLYKSTDTKDAKILMFASFIYLPIVQIMYVIDKL